jgi:aspartate carbamoyltransferase catalytic subunit
VINAGDGTGEHPTQALQDLYTIANERDTDNLTVALVGDLQFGRCPHSLMKLLCLYPGTTLVCVAPDQLQMPATFIRSTQERGLRVEQTSDVAVGLKHADVVYWTRIQDERIADKSGLEVIRDRYVLNREIVQRICKDSVMIMHPLPRVNELATDLDALPNAAYFRQAANSMLIRMALLLLVLDRDGEV